MIAAMIDARARGARAAAEGAEAVDHRVGEQQHLAAADQWGVYWFL